SFLESPVVDLERFTTRILKRLPELSNSGSLPGRAGGFPECLSQFDTSNRGPPSTCTTKNNTMLPESIWHPAPSSSRFYLDQILPFAHAPTTQESPLPPRYAIVVPWSEQACPTGTSTWSAGDARVGGSLGRRSSAGCALPHDALERGAER